MAITKKKGVYRNTKTGQTGKSADSVREAPASKNKSAGKNQTDPKVVAQFNAAREEAKKKGKSTSSGRLKNYNTFASSIGASMASSQDAPDRPDPIAPAATTPAGAGKYSYQYITKDGQMKTVSGASEAEAKALATDIAPTSGFMAVQPVYSEQTENGITSSSGNARQEESRLGSSIKSLSAPGYMSPARNTKYLDDYERSLTQLYRQSERSINDSYDDEESDTKNEQAEETGQTSVQLARMGGYLGGSASGTGAMLKLSASHRAELSSLESKRQKALTEARVAFSEKKFQVAKEKAAEARWWEEESYKRQQDFFDNQRALLSDERTERNMERDDARSVISSIIANTSGQDWAELSPDTQRTLEENALRAGYPIDVIKNMMAKPKAEMARIDQLLKDAAKKGAPASILSAISGAESFSEAAQIAAPYLAASSSGSGGGTGTSGGGPGGIKVSYVPSALQGPVSQLGTNQVYDDLLGGAVPSWFYPVVQHVTQNDPASLGLAQAFSDPDPNGWISQAVWDQFKKQPQVQTFVAEVNKKVLGSQALDYGGYSTSAPVPENIED